MKELGEEQIGGTILKRNNFASILQVYLDSGVKKVYYQQFQWST